MSVEELMVKEQTDPNALLRKQMQEAWIEADRVRKARMRRYAVAAGFIAFGFFLMFTALMMLLERLALPYLTVVSSYILVTCLGSVSFGYGFYRMGSY